MMGYSGVASAASVWNWDLVPDSPEDQTTTTLNGDEAISANYGFGVFAGGFSHKWSFSSGLDEQMDFYMNELRDENILIATITIDNVDMLFDTLKRRWFGVTTSTDNHHIFHVVGLSTRRGQAYQLQGIEVQQTVVTTPIPAAIWLFGSALAGLMGVSTHRKGFKALTA